MNLKPLFGGNNDFFSTVGDSLFTSTILKFGLNNWNNGEDPNLRYVLRNDIAVEQTGVTIENAMDALMPLKLFRILYIIMENGPKVDSEGNLRNTDTSFLVSKLIYEFNYCSTPFEYNDTFSPLSQRSNINAKKQYVKIWYNFQLRNQRYLAYAAFVFYGSLYYDIVSGTNLFRQFYSFMAYFISPHYWTTDRKIFDGANFDIYHKLDRANVTPVFNVNRVLGFTFTSLFEAEKEENIIRKRFEMFLTRWRREPSTINVGDEPAEPIFNIEPGRKNEDARQRIAFDGAARAFVQLHEEQFKMLCTAMNTVEIEYNPFTTMNVTTRAGDEITYDKLLSYDELQRNMLKEYKTPADFSDALDWEFGRQPFAKKPHLAIADNCYTTLYDMQQEFPKCFCTLDDIRHTITYYDNGYGNDSRDNLPRGDWSLTFPLLGATYVSDQRSFYDCRSSYNMVETIVQFLCTGTFDRSVDFDYYRFYNIIVDIKKLISTCKRRKAVYFGQYRPLLFNRRRFRPVRPMQDSRMVTDSDLIDRDQSLDASERYSCSNIAVIIMISASLFVRNYATCRFDVLMSHWKNMVQWYARENTDFYRSQVQMNLVSFDIEDEEEVLSMNSTARPAFVELLLALYAQSYTNDPSDLPKRPRAGISSNFEDVCFRYYNKMKTTGRLRLYDPYRIMTEDQFPSRSLRTEDVFRVLVFGYPENLEAPWLRMQNTMSL